MKKSINGKKYWAAMNISNRFNPFEFWICYQKSAKLFIIFISIIHIRIGKNIN